MPGQEIFEESVETVSSGVVGSPVEIYKPYDGKVKWFRDKLGYDWVKLREMVSDTEYQTRVIPAGLVLEVRYQKRALS